MLNELTAELKDSITHLQCTFDQYRSQEVQVYEVGDAIHKLLGQVKDGMTVEKIEKQATSEFNTLSAESNDLKNDKDPIVIN